jgi:hypothetical protein
MDRDAASLSPDLVAQLFDTSSHLQVPTERLKSGRGTTLGLGPGFSPCCVFLSLQSHHGVFLDSASHEIAISCIYTDMYLF